MKIIRVFPQRTSMTPDDSDVRINCGPDMFDEADEVHISVTFKYDIPKAEQLFRKWNHVAPAKIGGPAYDDRGDIFNPGMYIKQGNVITHRGCLNSCWFCDVWKREGQEIRLLPICNGWNLLDNNIFACPIDHQEKVYTMLFNQKKRARFTGGLEAARFTNYQAAWLKMLNPEYVYFAYDEPKDYEPLVSAARICKEFELFKGHSIGCYVLIGYPKDTFEDAERRLWQVVNLGIMPQAMLYNKGWDIKDENLRKQWKRFQREWANKVIVGSKMKKLKGDKLR